MKNKFAQNLTGIRVFKGKDGQFYFQIISPNGQVFATSEGYTRRWSAWRAAFYTKKNLNNR